MSQNGSDWRRSITIASPVLVAAPVSVVLAVTTMLNPAEATTLQEIPQVTAIALYAEFQTNPEAADAKYNGEHIEVSGIIASWGEDNNGQYYVSLVTDDSGGDFVRCIFTLSFYEELMPDLLGQKATLTGHCKGFVGEYVLLKNTFSDDIPLVNPGDSSE